MRKEIVFAIIAGVAIGSVFAYGVYRANKALDTPEISIFDREGGPSPTPTSVPENLPLTVSSPNEDELQTENTINIKGLASPNSFVIISAESEDQILKTENDGGFEADVELEPGLNRILVASFDESGSINNQILNIVYSSAYETDTRDVEDVRDEVEERIENAKNRTKVLIGEITDLTDSTIQVTDDSDRIVLVSVDSEHTDFIDSTNKSSTIDYEDLAIGNYTIAMGTYDENDVMNSSRVLVIEKPRELDRKMFFGPVVETGRRFVNISLGEDEKLSVNISKNLVVYDGKDEEIELADLIEDSV
ncbi:hypothetical protein ACFL2C_03605, partial [Patescibacteria group bacterium]